MDSMQGSLFHKSSVEQAIKAYLPARAIQTIAGAMSSHASMATKLLSDESARDVFLVMEYELLKRDAGAELLQGARQ
ncbi:hypothetical protein [Pseudomonas abietaniphila]|uniref:Type I restriction enzyme, R subunit n=1 Tax=Pseudomonas abietaniphila TaxID=89065 RepID=A0A1G8EW97_9PSED|nr:hypothetical protein [Pseudomonas abietaniphila]SDH74192.1 type I restriction enzyme, R subunit [Pseudomonas abietaniphila]